MNNKPPLLSSQQFISAIDRVIKKRKTLKVLGDLDQPVDIPSDFNTRIDESIKIANWAPFHYPANIIHREGVMNSLVPWRFYALSQKMCLELGHCLSDSPKSNVDKNSKIVRMLSACGGLVMVTWLPEPENGTDQTEKKKIAKQIVRDEHIAATGAATQNLLLAAEARNIQTYWSSGGILQSASCFNLCGIPEREKLMGAIFMFPEESSNRETVAGKLRDKRGVQTSWMSWIKINKSRINSV
ncbi:MAG: nitroreductase family protein [Cocleimonas sp.]|nr:nitroreductase family protein [Cocleimonas sp.]